MHLGSLALAALAGYLTVAAVFYLMQRRLLYAIDDEPPASPEDLNMSGVEDVFVRTAYTERLRAWYAPAAPGRPTILYFHGNGGSLVGRAARLEFYRQYGYGVLMTTYRGYSGSSGQPAELPIKMDALYFYHWLQARGVPERRIVLYGESLGTGVAVSTALHHQPGAVILEAPYSSIADIAAARFRWLPVRWFIKDRYDTMALIGGLTAPVLVVHGELDDVIPIRFAKKLFAVARQPKEAVWLRDASHHDLYSKGAFEVITRFVERHVTSSDEAV